MEVGLITCVCLSCWVKVGFIMCVFVLLGRGWFFHVCVCLVGSRSVLSRVCLSCWGEVGFITFVFFFFLMCVLGGVGGGGGGWSVTRWA